MVAHGSKIKMIDQVCSHLRVRREHLALVLLALPQLMSGVHLLPCQHLFKPEQLH